MDLPHCFYQMISLVIFADHEQERSRLLLRAGNTVTDRPQLKLDGAARPRRPTRDNSLTHVSNPDARSSKLLNLK